MRPALAGCEAAAASLATRSGGVRRRLLHSTPVSGYDARPVLAFNHVEAPSPEAAAG